MRSGTRRMPWGIALRLCVTFGMVATSTAAAERPADLAGWPGTRWGMTVAELDRALPGLDRLAKPIEFAGAQASRSLDSEFAGVPMLVLFQVGPHGLQQVLLQTSKRHASPKSHQRVAEELQARYGPPDATCRQAKDDGQPLLVEQVWRFPGTTVHATLLDFTTTGVFTQDPNAIDAPSYQAERRNHWRTMPHRIVIRHHPAERRDLAGDCR